MPPSVVLEVLRILRDETDLRELTRATEQAREAVYPHQYANDASRLEATQDHLRIRTQAVIDRLEQLQVAENRNFGRPIAQLTQAATAMSDATGLLQTPDTGAPTIAAETEAIEWLLLARKARPGGGGGGGATPGGSTSGGTTDQVASALTGIGEGIADKPRFVQQATGNVESQHPEEFKTGLDAYFSALEKGP